MNPRTTITIRTWTTRGVIATVALAAGAWVLAPRVGREPIEIDLSVPPAASDEGDQHEAIDVEAFDIALISPVEAEEREQSAERPRRVACTLQLIGIVTAADGTRSAILYDQATDTLHQAAFGEPVGAFEVASIDDGAVVVTGGGTTHTLSLETGKEDG